MQIQKNYIAELDGLRGIAVLAMLIEHVHIDFAFKQWFQSTTHLTSGVDIFFIASGFLTTRILLSDQETTRAKLSFYIRRAARLMPAYLLLLAVVAIIWGIGPELPWSLTYTFNYGRVYGFFLSQTRPLAHTWSLCVEEHFYLIWPWVFWTLRRHSTLVCLVAIAGGVIFPFLADREAGDQYLHYIRVYQPTHARLMSLAVGCLIALYEDKISQSPRVMLGLAALSASFLTILGYPALLQVVGVDLGATPLAVSLLKQNLTAVLVFSIAFWAYLAKCRPLSAFFADRRLRGTGNISYGLYLYHYPIYWLFAINGPDAQPSPYTPWLALVSVFVVASISSRYYEEPIRKWARAIIPRQRKELMTEEVGSEKSSIVNVNA